MRKTVRLTMGQALVRFLDAQYVSFDGKEEKFVQGVFGIFGHGCVVGFGEALEQTGHQLKFYKGCNEQGMAHAAVGFAKQHNRRQIIAVTTSIGPGAMNLVTAAALATTDRIPLLLLPGDTFACRQPDPVLQQLEQFDSLGLTSNDAFRAVTRYFDRIERPEQLMSAALQAMRVLTSPEDTGAVCLAMPQDVQGEAYDYPVEFFEKRIHYIERRRPSEALVGRTANLIARSKKPIMILGGGVRYSEAGKSFSDFAGTFCIPFGETQAGKGTVVWSDQMNLGGIGVTGGEAANTIAKDADLLIAVGTRLTDFTTCSKWLFQNDALQVVSINVCGFDLCKMNAHAMQCDARLGLDALFKVLAAKGWKSTYTDEIEKARAKWAKEVDHLYATEKAGNGYSQLCALGLLNEKLLPPDAIVVAASGSLPGDMQRVWRVRVPGTYHMEYGYSCMGYEVNAALGVKLAEGGKECFALVGDAGFVMLHSELLTSLENNVKINVIVFDNDGFGCIDNLQRSQGIPKFGCELVYRNPKTDRLDEGGRKMEVDYAKIAAGYGCKSWTVHTSEELEKAIAEAKESPVSTLIDVKVDENSMSKGYGSWWRVGTPEVSERTEVRKARAEMDEKIAQTRKF